MHDGYCVRVFCFFFDQLAELIKSYRGLFETGDGENGEEGSKPSRASFVEHWGWYYTLDSLSNNDRTKWEYFLNMKVIAFLNTLAYYKDKQDHIIEEQQKQMRRAGY